RASSGFQTCSHARHSGAPICRALARRARLGRPATRSRAQLRGNVDAVEIEVNLAIAEVALIGDAVASLVDVLVGVANPPAARRVRAFQSAEFTDCCG